MNINFTKKQVFGLLALSISMIFVLAPIAVRLENGNLSLNSNSAFAQSVTVIKPSCTINANPHTLNKGQSSIISWTSQRAVFRNLVAHNGSTAYKSVLVSANSSIQAFPPVSVTYTLHVKNAAGDISTCSTRVTVTQ